MSVLISVGESSVFNLKLICGLCINIKNVFDVADVSITVLLHFSPLDDGVLGLLLQRLL